MKCNICGAVSRHEFLHRIRHKLLGEKTSNSTTEPTAQLADKTFLDRSYIASVVGSDIKGSDLVIPVYLDYNALYGIWGTITGGFSKFEQRIIKSSKTETSKASIGGDAGLDISAIKLGVSGSKNEEETIGGDLERSLDLFQTDEALFNNLRLVLRQKLLKKIESWDKIEPSDFVEFRGVFRPNPLLRTLKLIDGILKKDYPEDDEYARHLKQNLEKLEKARKYLFEGLLEREGLGLGQGQGQGQMQSQVQNQKQTQEQLIAVPKIKGAQIFEIELTNEIKNSNQSKFTAVAALYPNYARDPSMTEISYREFSILGKVSRIIPEKGKGMDLLQGTPYGGPIVEELQRDIEPFLHRVYVPPEMQFRYKIDSPLLEVIPIAIYD